MWNRHSQQITTRWSCFQYRNTFNSLFTHRKFPSQEISTPFSTSSRTSTPRAEDTPSLETASPGHSPTPPSTPPPSPPPQVPRTTSTVESVPTCSSIPRLTPHPLCSSPPSRISASKDAAFTFAQRVNNRHHAHHLHSNIQLYNLYWYTMHSHTQKWVP